MAQEDACAIEKGLDTCPQSITGVLDEPLVDGPYARQDRPDAARGRQVGRREGRGGLRRTGALLSGSKWPWYEWTMDTNMLAPVAQLSNHELLARVKRLAERERGATAALIAHLAELDARPSTPPTDASRRPGPPGGSRSSSRGLLRAR